MNQGASCDRLPLNLLVVCQGRARLADLVQVVADAQALHALLLLDLRLVRAVHEGGGLCAGGLVLHRQGNWGPRDNVSRCQGVPVEPFRVLYN